MDRLIGYARRSAVALVLCGLLFGCGGGGGGGAGPGPAPTPAPTPSPPPEPECSDWDDPLELDDAVSHSVVNAVAVSGVCRFVVAGWERSTHAGEPLGDSRGFVRSFVVDGAGPPVRAWEYLLDTAGADAVYGVAVAADGIRFWGATTGAVDGHQNLGQKDVVLGHLTLQGEPLKISQLGNERPNVPLDLLAVTGGHVLIGNDEVYVPTNYVEAWEDPWLAEVSELPAGFSLDTMTNLDTPGTDLYTAAVLVDDSVVTALYAGSGPDRGISLQRRLPSGDPLWSLALSDSPYDHISSIRLRNDALLVLGSTYLQLGSEAFGAADYFLANVDPDTGELRWLRQFGTAADDWSRHLLVSDAAHYVLGEVVDEQGDWSAAIHQLDQDGAVVSQRTLRLGTSLAVTSGARRHGLLLMSGWLRRSDGRVSGFVTRLDDPTGGD